MIILILINIAITETLFQDLSEQLRNNLDDKSEIVFDLITQNETDDYFTKPYKSSTCNIDMSHTVVSGLSDLEVSQPKTITVTPFDSNEKIIGIGCDIHIQISNLCSVSQNDNF